MEAGTPSWHFTAKGGTVYAIASAWPGAEAAIGSLATAEIANVSLLGKSGTLEFTQDGQGLKIRLPAEHPAGSAFTLKIKLKN